MGRDVVITGIGAVLPNCEHRETLWRQLRNGESQLAFEPAPDGSGRKLAVGRIRDFDADSILSEISPRFRANYSRELQHYVGSVLRARDDAGLDLADVDAERVGLFDGSSRAAMAFWYERFQAAAGDSRPVSSRRDLISGLPGQSVGVAASCLRVQGPTYSFSGTCAAGGIAIGHAFREIRDGGLDVAFAGGHDGALVPPLFDSYGEAGLLSREAEDPHRAVRPWDGDSANAFGEGAVTLVLEEREHALRRGSRPLARICGYHHGNNGDHPMMVDPTGERLARVVTRLLENASMKPKDVCFVVGHGNGVPASDRSEEEGLRRVFGERASRVPLVSTKPIYGHTLGASSALNAAATVLMLHHRFIVPTINIDEAHPQRFNHQPNHGAPSDCYVGIATSFGMGGHNAALLFAREDRG